ncbi:MAG: sodium:solute symporter [Ignavibacteriales bacterium CG12_big_fil_rev_8_21_14_0_65_30_8]|nr:MAG: sodium:solute symporter [Ignavibacteriales bacterium CG12_big_fil_rev_8_21_14_0_65_30_8]
MSSLPIDYIIIVIYLITIAVFGIISGGKQKTTSDYFSGSKTIPWWAVCFSIVAAETSTLTFISIPGLAYLTNLNFLQITFGFLLGRIVVAYVFLPAYDKGGLKTAYTYLEDRFGKKTRSYASVVFLFTRTAADGVRLFATAIPLKLMLDISYPTAIIIIAVFSLIYTYTGGLKGIIWVDVIQMFIYLGGSVLAGIFILNLLPNGFESVINAANSADKFSVINLGFSDGIKNFFGQPYTLLGGILGGMFLSMASHGTDQLIVQRLFATKNLRDSQKAVIGSGVIIVIQFAIFLILGVMLYAYYGTINVKSDEIFPLFIIKVLPVGVTGIIIAGLFAAAMSTLAASMSSLSSSTVLDLYLPFTKKKLDEKKKLKYSRLVTVFWAVLLIIAAIFFMETSKAVVEIALSIASFTYGGLLGTFLLGIFVKNAKQSSALFGFSMGIVTMILVISFHLVAWTWFTLIGVTATIIFGKLFIRLQRK